MYKSFRIKNFRCFSDLAIDDLERINLVTGLNNVGKTALLEAIWLHCGKYRPELTSNLNAFRGIESYTISFPEGARLETPWDSFFGQFDTSQPLELKGTTVDGKTYAVKLNLVTEQKDLAAIRNSVMHGKKEFAGAVPMALESTLVLHLRCEEPRGKDSDYYLILDSRGLRTEPIPPVSTVKASFIASRVRSRVLQEADLFSKLQLENKQDVVVEALRVLEPRLSQLALITSGGVAAIYGDIGLGRLVPLNVMGEGTARLATIVLYICTSPRGVVLVDEVENGFHHSVLPKIWQVIAKTASDSDTQVFATTHSLECVSAAHQAFADAKRYDFRLYRLERSDDRIRAVSYGRQTLAAAIDAGLEVR